MPQGIGAGLAWLVQLAAWGVALAVLVALLRRVHAWAGEYAAGRRAPGAYWPAAAAVSVLACVAAAALGGYGTLVLALSSLPRGPYAEGAGQAAILAAVAGAAGAAVLCAGLLAWWLGVRPARRRRRRPLT